MPDGRRLAYAEWGDPAGEAVLFFHGTPGSRLFCPDSYRPGRTSADCGARVITVDRPGYGQSDPHPALTLPAWAEDVAALLDGLDIDHAPIIGLSAGGPYGIACAIRMPNRVPRLGLVSSLGPRQEVDWESFPADRKAMLETAVGDPFLVLDQMRERCAWLLTPEVMIDAESWGVDSWLIEDADARDVFLAALREAGRQGVDGYAWDRFALDTPWPFSAGDVEVETFIWNGDQDPELGQDHFAYLAATIPRAHATVWPDDGHAAVLRRDHWGEVLTTMRAH